MGFDPSYVSHVEARRHRPTEDFARRAEAVLKTGGAIWQRFREYDELRATDPRRVGLPGRDPPVPDQWLPPGTGLVVERETARLSHVGRQVPLHHPSHAATTPAPSRSPATSSGSPSTATRNDPSRSNRHHREHPLTLRGTRSGASCAAASRWSGGPSPTGTRSRRCGCSSRTRDGRFPLYPGERATIEYACTSARQVGPLVPARRTAAHPAAWPSARPPRRRSSPVVWGVENSLSAEAGPLRTPIDRQVTADGRSFTWETDEPALHARYRLEWRFRDDDSDHDEWLSSAVSPAMLL